MVHNQTAFIAALMATTLLTGASAWAANPAKDDTAASLGRQGVWQGLRRRCKRFSVCDAHAARDFRRPDRRRQEIRQHGR